MKHLQKKQQYNNLYNLTAELFDKNSIFYDIETTGFTAKNSHIYMIGVLYVCKETHTFKTIQWFLVYLQSCATKSPQSNFSEQFYHCKRKPCTH